MTAMNSNPDEFSMIYLDMDLDLDLELDRPNFSHSSLHGPDPYLHTDASEGLDAPSIPKSSCSKPEHPTYSLLSCEGDHSGVHLHHDGEMEMIYDSDEEMRRESQNHTVHANKRTLAALERIVLSFLEQLVASPADQIQLTLIDRLKVQDDKTKTLRWPKRYKNGSFKRFACLFRVIDLISEALTTNIPTTKRDIYYKDVSLFKTQSVVDELVDDLAATIGVTRTDLNVRASSKGLFCGSGLAIHLRHGGLICGNDGEGALIPAGAEVLHLEVDDALSWILIVEKEAVFQTLCRARVSSSRLCPGPGIIITGKGYPDLATRELVSRLSLSLPTSIPILALMDADPYGLDILSVYRFGSQNLSHEGSKTRAPRIAWLGICASELFSLGIDRDQLIPITKHDHKKALEMLRRSDDLMPTQWRKEISFMLHTRRKAEIEIIESSASRLVLQPGSSQQSLRDIFQDEGVLAEGVESNLVQYVILKLKFWVTAV